MSQKPLKQEKQTAHSLSFKKRLRLWWAEYQWIVLGVAGLLIFCLGYVGFKQLYANSEVKRTPFDLMTLSFKLFRVGADIPPGPKPWQLEAARTLATLITMIAAIKAFMLFFQEKFQRFRLSRWKEHIVICGLGRKGTQLADELIKQGEQVVIVEIDKKNSEIENFLEKGAVVLPGDATSQEILKKARVAYARYVFVVGGDDKINLEIALLSHRLMNQDSRKECSIILTSTVAQPARQAADIDQSGQFPLSRCCFVHLIDLELRDLLTQHKVFLGTEGQVPVKCFNIFENSARQLFLSHPPEIITREIGHDVPHLLIVGFGRMGQSVALQAAKVGHYAHDKTIRITVIDKEAKKKAQLFFHKYPAFSKICEIAIVELDIDNVSFLNGSFLTEYGGREMVTEVVVCLGKEAIGLVCGLNLAKLFRGTKSPLFIRMSVETELISFLQNEIGGRSQNGNTQQTFLPFGGVAGCCSIEMVINEEQDRMAREVHAGYVRVNLAKDPSLANKPSMQQWPELDEDFKESNRQQTEHIDIKLRTIGCYRRPMTTLGKTAFAFTLEEIELLAHMEHARWNAERWLSGWEFREGLEGSDPVHKWSPYLVTWEQLSEDIRQYDRDTVVNIPAILAQIGQEIARQSSPRT